MRGGICWWNSDSEEITGSSALALLLSAVCGDQLSNLVDQK